MDELTGSIIHTQESSKIPDMEEHSRNLPKSLASPSTTIAKKNKSEEDEDEEEEDTIPCESEIALRQRRVNEQIVQSNLELVTRESCTVD